MAKAIILIKRDERWDSKQPGEQDCSSDFQGGCYEDIALSPHVWCKREQLGNSSSLMPAVILAGLIAESEPTWPMKDSAESLIIASVKENARQYKESTGGEKV